jgi:hypothetical protein
MLFRLLSPRKRFRRSPTNANTGLAVTCVYGITKEELRIKESVGAFMRRLRITKSFRTTNPSEWFPAWINGSAVVSIRAPLPNEYVAGVKTVIFADSFTLGVKESPADVTAAVNDHGGDL